jgi:6-pyruvoyltetrahydropterin/6-carboxytetrahydropterin synthase
MRLYASGVSIATRQPIIYRPVHLSTSADGRSSGVQPVLTITRRATFSAAHRLSLSHWDDARNQAVFGRCANPGGHGHNYVVEVTIGGELDPETGMIADLKWVKEVMDRSVIEHVDHRNLNDVELLDGLVPTAENLARVFWERLVGPISERATLVRVRVQETENNAATYDLS